nr:hypothetical protein [Plantactinospora sp. BB1]
MSTTGLRLCTVRSSQYANSSIVSVPLVTTTASDFFRAASTARVRAWNSAMV